MGYNKITEEQKKALIKEIAWLIVYRKGDVVVAMNKSGIETVSKGTPTNILIDRVVDGLHKNRIFAVNFANLITDINLKQMIEEGETRNAEGDVTKESTTTVDKTTVKTLSEKITNAVISLAHSLVETGIKAKDALKKLLRGAVSEEQIAKEKAESSIRAGKTATSAAKYGIILTVLGATGLVFLTVWLFKKYGIKTKI